MPVTPLLISSAALRLTLGLLVGLLLVSLGRAQAPAQPSAQADPAPVDKVIAVIDDEIILYSDIENQVNYLIQSGRREDRAFLRCQVFDQLLQEKLLLVKAKLDSIEVRDEQVDREVDRRIQYYTSQAGSVQELEKIYKKSLIEIKVDLRNDVRNQLLAQEQRAKISEGIKATPLEVREFFGKIPRDSLPLLPAEVEIAHILMQPKPSKASKDAARRKLEGIRSQIASGELTFEQCARVYGMDGTSRQDGDLGEFGRGMMTPAFEEQVYLLNEAQLSPVFETEFGYHLVRLDRRLGDRVRARHILIIPQITPEDEALCKQQLMKVRERVLSDSMTFEKAAAEYSQDPNTKDNGGLIMLNGTDMRIPLDQLESDLYFKIDQMKVGELSEPMEYQQRGAREKAFHIVKLRARLAPHQANLNDDYQKFYNATVQSKQAAELSNWFRRSRQQVFVEIKDIGCAQALQHWY